VSGEGPAASVPPAAPGAAPGTGIVRFHTSILYKVVGVLVVTLVVSSIVTAVIASRLTSNALDRQTEGIAASQLNVLKQAFDLRGQQLVASMRNLADTVNSAGLTDPAKQVQLIAEMNQASANFDIDIIRVLDPLGGELDPPVGIGTPLGHTIFSGDRLSVEPASRLLESSDGRYVQAVTVGLGGSERRVLAGAFLFDDAFAFRLRNQILDDVVVVASGKIVGTTLPGHPAVPPGQADGVLPTRPTVVRVEDRGSLVAYVRVGLNADDPVGGALGVILTNPVAPLQRSLDDTRLLASVLLTLVALGLGWVLFRALIRPLVNLAATAQRVAGGDADATFVRRGNDEIGMLARSLEHMRVELKARLDLIARQAADLQESSQRIVAAEDEERQRLSRDLHDGIQQQLVVLRMQVGMLQDGIGPGADDPSRAYDSLGAELDRVIEQLREVTHNLYPSILVDRGLTAALHSYVGRLPLTTVVTCLPEDFPRLAPEIESGAYFLLGEAVTNALKHARATRIDIGLRLVDGWLEVTVADDGVGFDPDQSVQRGGLLHMEDRVRSFGGQLTIASPLGGGTRVVATFPQGVGVEAATPG
jgi:signal transduction histidine kinase